MATAEMDDMNSSTQIPSNFEDLQNNPNAMIESYGAPPPPPPPPDSLGQPVMQSQISAPPPPSNTATTTQHQQQPQQSSSTASPPQMPSTQTQQQQQQHQTQEQQQNSGAASSSTSNPTMPVTGRPKSPIVHGSYEKVESDEEEVMVKTEFVWADGAELDVKLSGAWNGWMPVQMYHEGGGMWSVVTPVPAGTHEFKFVVDGEWKHSTRHPTVGDDDETMNNIRVIRGPPKNKQNTARLSEQRNKEAGVTSSKKKMCCVS